MAISIYIDSCAWNYLFEHNVDLANELPHGEFAIFLTREVEIEIGSIPDFGKDENSTDKRPLKNYIKKSIEENCIPTTSIFGFASCEPDGSLSKIQTNGGFGQGTFQSAEERSWYASDAVKKHFPSNKIQNSGLGKNQADASLAVRSFNSIVLTNEYKEKSGPLNTAVTQGGKVVNLSNEFESSGKSLRDYLQSLS